MSKGKPLMHCRIFAARLAEKESFGDCKGKLMTTWAVYNSQGQFFARFITYRRALAWAIRNGMEWTAQIVKEKENTK